MDPCASYRAAVRQSLPNARVAADHFHLVRLANQALTDARRRVSWDTNGRRCRGASPGGPVNRKEELRALLATAKTGRQRHDVAHRLHRFNSWCANSQMPELERLAATIEDWWAEVLGYLQTGITNAGTEATNRTVRTTSRIAYGFRNIDNQRLRVRFACTRRHRRATDC